MKANQEIEMEAGQLMVLGRQYRDEHRESPGVAAMPAPRVLAWLPESRVTSYHQTEPESKSVHVHRRQRHVEAAMERGEVMLRLMERETETTGSGRIVREDAPSLVIASQSAYDVLRTGYELVEEERLGELLLPYAERAEDADYSDPADARAVAEVETILEANMLSAADRLRTRAEIVAFLEGRLEPSAFITRSIDRQTARAGQHERLAERHTIKLTIDEP